MAPKVRLRSASLSPPPVKRLRLTGSSDRAVPENLLCIYSWNINGIQPFVQSSLDHYLIANKTEKAHQQYVPNSLRNFLKRHDWPQVLHLQEVKIPLNDTATQRSLQAAVNTCRHGGPDNGPAYEVRFCLPRDKFNATGFGRKVYGVASIIREDFYRDHVQVVREVDWDKEGRILVIETKSKLSIWNVYAVNGTDAALKDSSTGKVTGTRHDRKLAFHRLLVDECKGLLNDGFSVVVSGDLNVARAPIDGFPKLRTKPEQHVQNRKDFNERFFNDADGLQAIDTFRELHPDKRLYSWMSRNRPWKESCDRVDYILVTPNLKSALRSAEILMTPSDRGPSDHFPISLHMTLAPAPNNKSG